MTVFEIIAIVGLVFCVYQCQKIAEEYKDYKRRR